MSEPTTETSVPASASTKPVDLPVAKVCKCSKCKHYYPIENTSLEYSAYCDNNNNRGKHMSALLLCIERTQTLEPITLREAQKAFREECEKVMDFIEDYGCPITGPEYGRECFVAKAETDATV